MRMTERNRARSLKVSGVLFACLIAAVPAIAQAKVTCRVGVLGNEKFTTTIGMQHMVDLINTKIGNAVEAQLFPNSQLGGEKEMAEGMRLGSVCAAPINVSVMTDWVPEGELFDMPFIFRDDGHANRTLTGEVGQRIAAMYKPHGFTVPGFLLNGVRHPMASKPILRPGDVKGMKIRVIQSPLHLELWRLLGANPTPIAFPELYNALQTGVVDGFDNVKTTYAAQRFYEVAPHITDLGHIYSISAVAFANSFWDRLTSEQQEVVRAAAVAGIALNDRLVIEGDVSAVDLAIAAGAFYHRVDRKPWMDAMQPIYKIWAPKIGGTELIEAVRNTP